VNKFDVNNLVSSEAFDTPDINSPTIITSHPVHFYFNNVEKGYHLSKGDRESFIRYVKKLMKKEMKMDDDWELIQVAYASRFELDEEDESIPTLPVRVTVRGDEDTDLDEALDYIMEVMEDLAEDFEKNIKALDRKIFKDVFITYESNDLPDFTVPTYITDHPALLIIKNAPPGYRLTPEFRAKIIKYMKELIEDNLGDIDEMLELLDLVYEGKMTESKPGVLELPLRVTVRGPSGAADDTTEYVEEIVLEKVIEFKDFLTDLDEGKQYTIMLLHWFVSI